MLDGQVNFLSKGNSLVTGPGVVTGGRDDLQSRVECAERHLKADLIVALTGAAVGDVGTAVLLCSLHEVLDNEGARDGRHQRVLLHVHTVGLDSRQAVLFGELVLGVNDDGFDSTTVESTLTHGLHVLAALPQVEGDGNHLTTGHLGQVRDGNGSIQSARVGKYNTCSHSELLLRVIQGAITLIEFILYRRSYKC